MMNVRKRGGLLATTALVTVTLGVTGLTLATIMAPMAEGSTAPRPAPQQAGFVNEGSGADAAPAAPAGRESGSSALFDPGYLARAVCGTGMRTAKPQPAVIQVAAATAAGEASQPQADRADQPLWDNLGDLTFPITTSDPKAQQYFDQGLRLANGFNHAEALRSFRVAQRLDPRCAMCFWGEALVHGPTINTPMADAAVASAVAAVTRAQALADGASEKEQALIWALARRYSANPEVDRATLDANYADAMGEVAANFPDDQNVAVLHAEAMMDTQPWNYWEADRVTPRGRTAEIIATLERVLAVNPDHPAAIHLYIHTTEASATPERAEPYADRLGRLMPGAGHIVHMPSHTYFRVGRYRDSLATNVAAVQADETYLAQVEAAGLYPGAYYPHNIHYVVESARMAGAAKTAIEYADKLDGVLSDDILRSVPWVQVIKVAPYFTHAQFSPPETVLAIPAPTTDLPYVEAMWHYMRAIALITAGDLEQARPEADALARIGAEASFQDMVEGGVPAPDLLRIAARVLAARMAVAENDLVRAEREYRAAVEIQDGVAYMEPPYWYYPVRQSLGAVLLEQGRAEEAEQVFRRTLINYPNNGWALYGLMRAQAAQKDEAGAQSTARLLNQAWLGDRSKLTLARL